MKKCRKLQFLHWPTRGSLQKQVNPTDSHAKMTNFSFETSMFIPWYIKDLSRK